MSWPKSNLQTESVAANKFFQILRDSYPKLYEQAAPNGWIVCVPHSNSIKSLSFNLDVFKSHILHSSPYFKEEYVTLNGQCVTVKDGIVSTKTGFDAQCKVSILSEELFYNQEFKSFTVYSVSAPLTLGNNGKNYHHGGDDSYHNENGHGHNDRNEHMNNHDKHNKTSMKSGDGSENMSEEERKALENDEKIDKLLQICVENRRIEDYHRLVTLWLNNGLIYSNIMNELNRFANQFDKSYVMIKGYTHSAAKRIENFRKDLFANVFDKQSEKFNNNSNNNKHERRRSKRSKSKSSSSSKNDEAAELSAFEKSNIENKEFELALAFDCILIDTLYKRIFEHSLCKDYQKEDLTFFNKCDQLKQMSQASIGIEAHFECDLSLAIEELSYLDSFQTPVEKIGCIKKSIHLIRQAIDIVQESKKSYAKSSNSKDNALTTDDILSLFTYVLIQSNLKHVVSTCEYLTHFHFKNEVSSHLDYYLVTFQGCVEYIDKQLSEPKNGVNNNNKQNGVQNSHDNNREMKSPDENIIDNANGSHASHASHANHTNYSNDIRPNRFKSEKMDRNAHTRHSKHHRHDRHGRHSVDRVNGVAARPHPPPPPPPPPRGSSSSSTSSSSSKSKKFKSRKDGNSNSNGNDFYIPKRKAKFAVKSVADDQGPDLNDVVARLDSLRFDRTSGQW